MPERSAQRRTPVLAADADAHLVDAALHGPFEDLLRVDILAFELERRITVGFRGETLRDAVRDINLGSDR
jgi:hypothetical protein